MSEPSHRNLLIALAMSPLHRAAICRLGTTVRDWSTVGGVGATREVARRLGLPIGQLRRALDLRRHASLLAGAEEKLARRIEGRIVTLLDPDFPAEFHALPLPPPALYLRGTLAPANTTIERPDRRAWPTIAMVGSRIPDTYGRACAERFASGLAAAGLTIASGFAKGIDQACHRASLDCHGGRTIAVLGCGLDIDYPVRSRGLADAIASRGALLTELPMGTEPRPHHFPMRNRLIAALGIGVLVVQAKARSGSLITAHHALDLGREVWAVPGPIDSPLASGPNGLIADGAMLVQSPEDILTTLPLEAQQTLFPSRKAAVSESSSEPSSRQGQTDAATAPSASNPRASGPTHPSTPTPPLRGLAAKVFEALGAGPPRTAESLVADSEASIDRVLGVLLELELAGLVSRLPGPLYAQV